MRWRSCAVVAGVFSVTLGCGYVGPVVPPSPSIPAGISDLSVTERGDQLLIQFTTPVRTTDNLTISRLTAVDLRIGPSLNTFNEEAWAQSARPIPVDTATEQTEGRANAVEQQIPAADWVGKRVTVMVRTAAKKGDHFSQWSNRVTVDVVAPLSPPELRVEPTAAGYHLSWDRGNVPNDAPVHYDVLRQAASDKAPVRLNATDKQEYVDASAQWEVPYTYMVISREGAASSLPSKGQQVQAADTFPPSVPSDVAAFATGDHIEVTWTRSPETDLAMYLVYRAQGSGPFARIGDPVRVPTFSDAAVEHGQTYHYEISAVDRKGNESARSAPADVTLP